MIVGKLFVALGVKGPKKAIGAIDDVKKSLKDTAGMGLEAKAAILGAVYALEKLFAKSGAAGTNLTNFNATVGVSAQTLQKYQYAARQVGVSNEAVEGSFRSLQSSITSTLMGKGAPEGLARVAQVVASIGEKMSATDLDEFAQDPSKLLQRLQQYAQIEKNAGLRNATLKSFGLGDDMIAGLTRNAFTPQVMNKAPTYSDNEIKQLDKANIAWSNLGNKIEMAIGHLNAAHGGKLVSEISAVADQVLRVTEAFLKLAEKLKLFEGIGKVFEGWTKIFSGLVGGVDAISDAADDPKKAGELKENAKSFLSDLAGFAAESLGGVKDVAKGFIDDHGAEVVQGAKYVGTKAVRSVGETVFGKAPTAATPPSPVAVPTAPSPVNTPGPDLKLVPPPVGAVPPPGAQVTGAAAAAPAAPASISTQNNTNTVNQSLNFQHDGRDAKQTGDSVKRATQQALRQMPGLAQGS